jgi:hypothetical protein
LSNNFQDLAMNDDNKSSMTDNLKEGGAEEENAEQRDSRNVSGFQGSKSNFGRSFDYRPNERRNVSRSPLRSSSPTNEVKEEQRTIRDRSPLAPLRSNANEAGARESYTVTETVVREQFRQTSGNSFSMYEQHREKREQMEHVEY